MKGLRKFRPKYLFSGALTSLLFFTQTWKTPENHTSQRSFDSALTFSADTIPSSKDSLQLKRILTADTIPNRDSINLRDSFPATIIDTFTLKASPDSLDAPVNYEASDSAVVLVKEKKVILYGSTQMKYKTIEITAPKMEIDQSTQVLTAFGSVDSLGEIITRARFRDDQESFQADTFQYNFKSQRGITKNTFTQHGEFIIQSERAKRQGDIIYASNGVITTCNYDHPHFGFHYNKIKVINNKVAVTGPIHPEFESVPVPVYLPFGYFPLNKGRHSGFLPPQFTANEDFGLGLEGIGYYKVLNDYIDVTLRGNIYSYGGWTANITPTYRKRYRYNGSLNLSVQSTKFNFKGDPDFIKNRSYFITWSHSLDRAARPGTSFQASVNAGSTTYNDYIPNNPNRNFQNQFGSSISWAKQWDGKPYNLSINATHSQNDQLHLINLNLPDVSFSVNTIYPFQAKEFVGTPKWYEKIGVGYQGNVRSQVSFYDTAFRFQQLIDTLQWGGQHNFPITTALPPLLGGRLIVSPSVSYEQKWIAQKFRRSWDDTRKKVDTSVTKGFYNDHKVSFGLGLNTALYGRYEFKNTVFRHVVRPSISVNYSPSLSKEHFYWTQVDTAGRMLRFSEFEGSLFGFYGEHDYGGLGFSVDNNLEYKRKNKKDSIGAEERPIRLIDGYGFSTGYNFLLDSMKLAPINFYLRSTLFEKIHITAGALLNPYKVNDKGYPIDVFAWEGQGFSFGRISNGSLSVTTDFRSKPKDEKLEQDRKRRAQEFLNDPALAGDFQSQQDYMQRNPAEFVDFNIPWTLSLGLSVYFTERLNQQYEFEKEFSSNLNFNGSFNLTPKWNFSVNGYYDFDTRNLQTFQMSIAREMHCWQMAINVTPVGPFRYFNITISPKSALLQDLKINRTRYFYNY